MKSSKPFQQQISDFEMNQPRLKTNHVGHASPSTIEPTEMRSGKPVIRYFVSYSHDDEDKKLKGDLLKRLKQSLAIATDYCFIPWDDEEILPGERWHEQIQKAIDHCHFGLLLVSKAFLGSEYIKKHELPAFVASDLTNPEPEKRVIPVALKRVPFDRSIDLKGLEHLQIFHDSDGKTFQERVGRTRDEFTEALFQQILKIVRRYGTLSPAPNSHSQDAKFCAQMEDEIKPGLRKTAQALIVVILQQSDAVTQRLAARFSLGCGNIVNCREQVAGKALDTELDVLLDMARDEQWALINDQDYQGAEVVARFVQAILPVLHESADVENVRARHRLEQGILLELHASHMTIAEIIMAAADRRPAAFVRPRKDTEFTRGLICLAPVPEGGRDRQGEQLLSDLTEELVQSFESGFDERFEPAFESSLWVQSKEGLSGPPKLKSDAERRQYEEKMTKWIRKNLKDKAKEQARKLDAAGCQFTFYFLLGTPPGLTDAERDMQNATLLRLQHKFPEIAFLRLASTLDSSIEELLPYTELPKLLYANPEPR